MTREQAHKIADAIDDIDIGDITETALDMLLEDENETDKKITLDDSPYY